MHAYQWNFRNLFLKNKSMAKLNETLELVKQQQKLIESLLKMIVELEIEVTHLRNEKK